MTVVSEREREKKVRQGWPKPTPPNNAQGVDLTGEDYQSNDSIGESSRGSVSKKVILFSTRYL